jgi:predicted nucleic acid-binding protein
MKKILFDAHPILKWTQKEKGYQRVKSLLIECRNQSVLGYMNQINLGEVYYKTIRIVGLDGAKKFLENFLRLPISIILPDSDLIWKASEIKAEYSISYADCFAAATALQYGVAILTGDPEFKKIESLVSIDWI